MSEPHPRRGTLRAWLAWWVVCAAVWLALVDRTPLDELLTGLVATTLGATAAVLVRSQRILLLRPRARWIKAAWRPALALATDLWPLARALPRRERGVIHELPFGVVGENPDDAAFRSVNVALGSVGPNTIVLDIDTERRVLYAHQLVPTADPARSAIPLREP
jgi:multisubunit Na+/H+ antiporter MnhE subunit